MKELSEQEKSILIASWPDDFGEIYSIGMLTYKKFFDKNTKFEKIFGYGLKDVSTTDWYRHDDFKQQALSLMQIVEGHIQFCLQSKATIYRDEYENKLRYLGYLHHQHVSDLEPSHFDEMISIFAEELYKNKSMSKLSAKEQDEAKRLWSLILANIGTLLKEGCGGKAFVITEDIASDAMQNCFSRLKSRQK